jgi:hypothetical protein
MIEIQHISTGEIKKVSVYSWDQNQENHNTWIIIKEYDLVQLYYHPADKKMSVQRHRMEKKDAIDFVKKNPDYFTVDLENRLSIQDEPPPEVEPKYKINPNWKPRTIKDKVIERYEKEHLHLGLDKNIPINNPTTIIAQPQITNNKPETWVSKIYKWIIEKTSFIFLWVLIGIIGGTIAGLLILCIVNYAHGMGFKL